jgi:hypothetical protein
MASTKHASSEREGVQVQIRPTKKRHLPFFGSLLVTFVVLPVLFAISRGVMLWDEATGILVAHGWFVSGSLVSMVAIGVGMYHAKRTNFVVKHVALTLVSVGVAGDLFTLVGFKHRFLDVLFVFGALIVWGSWMLYRIDVFRAKATGESGDSWGDLVGLARSRPKNVRATENQVTFDVEHGAGETHADVERGVKKLANAAGAITGRVRVVEGERGGVSHASWSIADTFADWRNFPGPSHPGLSFAYPFRTAWYEDGEDEWFGFTPTFSDLARSRVTSFVAPMATFVGAAGITGGGKSGFLNGVAAEALTRIDVIPIWVDAEKLFQNAGWCLDMLGLAAGTPAQVKTLTRGLRGLAEYRVETFGQAALDSVMDPNKPMQGREWTPWLAAETGCPAILLIVDEADTIIRTRAWEWLAARGRSLGIFLCVGAPRVSTAEVSALLRGSVGAWKTFGMGDQISGMFTLPDDVRETVQPERLRDPGLHYLTGAPGVDRPRWSILAREFKNDARVLRQMVIAAREGRLIDADTQEPVCPAFTPMGFSEDEQRWLGDAWLQLRPEVLMALQAAGPTRGDEDEDGAVAAVPEDPQRRGRIAVEDDMERTQQVGATGVEDEDDPETGGKRVVRTSAEGTVDDDLAAMDNSALDRDVAAEAGRVDLDKPFNTTVPDGPPVTVPLTKPRPVSEADEIEALDEVFRAFAEDPKFREFGNTDVIDALRVHVTPATMSRRLQALSSGERLMPPGLTLEPVPGRRKGRWQILRTGPRPRLPRGQEG